MKPRRIIAESDTCELLDQAAAEHALAVLNVAVGDQWITYKSRFLERDPKRRFIVLDYQPTHGTIPPADLAPGQYVGISFRLRSRKVMFASVLEARGKFVVDGQGDLPAARYRWPDSLTELQRRAYYRTPVPAGMSLAAGVWPGGVTGRTAAQRTALGVVSGEALDISCGGCLVRVATTQPPPWPDDHTVGIELQLPDGRPALLINGYYRGARHDTDGHLCLALQFVGLEVSPDGRGALYRLARCVQKFHRLTFGAESRTPSALQDTD